MNRDMMEHLPRSIQEQCRLEEEILNGDFGPDGAPFLTIRELAERRGVSIVTAQHILVGLREKGLVRLQGKKHFLSYGAAAGQKDRAGKIIGLHVTNIGNQYFAALAKAVQKSAARRGYEVLISGSSYSPERERDILSLFRQIRAVGVLSCPGVGADIRELYRDYDIPHIFLGRELEGDDTQAVLVNNYPAARKVAAHLVRQGYREFVYIGPKELDNSEDIRFSGFRDGLARDGHSLRKEDVIRVGIQNANSGAQALAERLARRKKPVGIFCFHDLFGVMAVRTCARLKLDIPKEAGVAGFDNLPVASCLIPTLTTVGYHVGEMAEVAVRLLVDRMEGRAPKDVNYYLEPSLIVRASTSAEPAHQAAPDSLFRMAQDMLHDSVV